MWIILILILILITVITKNIKKGNNVKNIYLKKSKKGNNIGTLGYILLLYQDQDYYYKHLYGYFIRDMLINENTDIDYFINKTYLEKYKKGNPEFDIDYYTEFFNKIYNLFKLKQYKLTFKKTKYKLCVYTLPKRKLLDINADSNIILNCVAMNWILNFISPGNQWSLVSDIQINKLIRLDFKIECFGSAYNTRLPWFGSISELDNPWGRLGTYTDILQTLITKKPLMWKNTLIYNSDDIIRITANPPSILCNTEFLNILNTLLEIRKGTIYIDISTSNTELVTEFKNSRWYLGSRILSTGYSLWDNKTCNMKGREWINIIFSNENIDIEKFFV